MNKITVLLLFIFQFAFTSSFSQHYGGEKMERTVQDIGDVLQIALPAGAGLSAVLLGDNEGVWQLTKAYVTTVGLTYVMKYAINKPRPRGATDGHAFPSGHASSAFSGASFIQKRYGWAYGAPAYALAGFVGYSRIAGYHHRHDIWDVSWGAIIGIGSTYIFTTPYQKEHFELTFSSGDDLYLLGFNYKF